MDSRPIQGGGGGVVVFLVAYLHLGIPEKSDNKPWAYICSKGFFAGLIFGGAYFRRGFLLEGILRFKMGLACQ